jgi:purine nucleosidase
MPDEMMSAYVIDPSVFSNFDDMYIDIVTTNDGHYGDTSFWDANWKTASETAPPLNQNNPSLKAGRVNVASDLDKKRFRELFIDLMTRPINKSKA